jgi:hypothetical protein
VGKGKNDGGNICGISGGRNRILGAAVVVECSRTKRNLWSQEEGISTTFKANDLK